MTLNPIDRLYIRASEKLVPLNVTVELTRRCNYRCAHCYIPAHDTQDMLTTERILALLDELRAMGTLYICFTGGEVFLREDWPVLAETARRKGFALTILSNGSLIGDEEAARLAELFIKVEISLHAADPKTFEGVTGVIGSFDRTMEGIENLKKHGVPVRLKVLLMTLNKQNADETLILARRLGLETKVYHKLIVRLDGDPSPLCLQLPSRDLLDYYRSPLSGFQEFMKGAGDRDLLGPLCAAGNRLADISADGDVMAYSSLPMAAGNILESSFREIWENSPGMREVRDIRKGDLSETCRPCSKLAYCGRCHAEALVEGGDILGPAPRACVQAETLEKLFGPIPPTPIDR